MLLSYNRLCCIPLTPPLSHFNLRTQEFVEVTRMDIITNEYIRGIAQWYGDKYREPRLRWFGYVHKGIVHIRRKLNIGVVWNEEKRKTA